MYNKKEREQYNQHREYVCETLGITKNKYNWFRRQGEKLHKLFEDNCNGLITESDGISGDDIYQCKFDELSDNSWLKAKKLGLFIYYQTDPRGATIYLDTKPIPENNYTTAYCIY